MVNQVATEEEAGKTLSSFISSVPDGASAAIRAGVELETNMERGQQSNEPVPA